MSKTGHNIVGLSLAASLFCFDQNVFTSMGILMGATAPDYLEGSFYDTLSGRYKRIIPHRTITHSIWLWVILLYCLIEYTPQANSVFPPQGIMIATGFIYGALSHLAADICTPMGIPLLNPFGKRFSLNLYKTGRGEWRVLTPIVVIASGLSYSLWSGAL